MKTAPLDQGELAVKLQLPTLGQRGRMAILLTASLFVAACGDSGEGTVPDGSDGAALAETSDDAKGDVSVPDAADGLGDADATVPDTIDDGTADGTSDGDAQAEVVTPPKAGCDNIVTLLDNVPVSVIGGLSEEFSITVPTNAVSVAVSVVGAIEDSNQYNLGSWLQPGGVLMAKGWETLQQNQGGLCFTCALRTASIQGTFGAMAPNNPNATFAAGEHRLSVTAMKPPEGIFGGQPTPVDDDVFVTVQAKVLDGGLPATGTLHLNLHFTGAEGWNATMAPNDAGVQALLSEVADIYSKVGVTIGEVTYTDVPEEFRVIEDFDGPNSDLQRLFASSEVQDNHHLNLFFVDELVGPFGNLGFGVVLGISGGIPGPPLLHGTPRSGVAVAIKPNPQFPAAVETTMAHEMGHFLGLFHTIEQNFFGGPPITDPLPDTPATDDNSWLMHNSGSGSTMSEWQGIVVRSNPWVCHPSAGDSQ